MPRTRQRSGSAGKRSSKAASKLSSRVRFEPLASARSAERTKRGSRRVNHIPPSGAGSDDDMEDMGKWCCCQQRTAIALTAILVLGGLAIVLTGMQLRQWMTYRKDLRSAGLGLIQIDVGLINYFAEDTLSCRLDAAEPCMARGVRSIKNLPGTRSDALLRAASITFTLGFSTLCLAFLAGLGLLNSWLCAKGGLLRLISRRTSQMMLLLAALLGLLTSITFYSQLNEHRDVSGFLASQANTDLVGFGASGYLVCGGSMAFLAAALALIAQKTLCKAQQVNVADLERAAKEAHARRHAV